MLDLNVDPERIAMINPQRLIRTCPRSVTDLTTIAMLEDENTDLTHRHGSMTVTKMALETHHCLARLCVSAGYVADNTDCDDTTALTYPSAPEYCDGQDNNCNSIVDESR